MYKYSIVHIFADFFLTVRVFFYDNKAIPSFKTFNQQDAIPQNNTEDSAKKTLNQASWPTLVFLCFGLDFVIIYPKHLHLLLQVFLTNLVCLETVAHKLVLVWTARGEVFLLGALARWFWQV